MFWQGPGKAVVPDSVTSGPELVDWLHRELQKRKVNFSSDGFTFFRLGRELQKREVKFSSDGFTFFRLGRELQKRKVKFSSDGFMFFRLGRLGFF